MFNEPVTFMTGQNVSRKSRILCVIHEYTIMDLRKRKLLNCLLIYEQGKSFSFYRVHSGEFFIKFDAKLLSSLGQSFSKKQTERTYSRIVRANNSN